MCTDKSKGVLSACGLEGAGVMVWLQLGVRGTEHGRPGGWGRVGKFTSTAEEAKRQGKESQLYSVCKGTAESI